MQIYRELFYNNVEDFLASSFPVIRAITDDARWHAMVRDYFSHHKAKTPLFPEMPREFLQYLESEREPQTEDMPFLLELAHYEWVELALTIAEQKLPAHHHKGDLLAQIPVLSPLAWPLQYRYPVHQISPDFLPQQVGENVTSLVVYRDRQDEVGFLEINPVTACMLALLKDNKDKTGLQILQQIAQQLNHPAPQQVVQGGAEILQNLLERDILLGSQ